MHDSRATSNEWHDSVHHAARTATGWLPLYPTARTGGVGSMCRTGHVRYPLPATIGCTSGRHAPFLAQLRLPPCPRAPACADPCLRSARERHPIHTNMRFLVSTPSSKETKEQALAHVGAFARCVPSASAPAVAFTRPSRAYTCHACGAIRCATQ
eukprot:6214772-Pleurochrysis_carterae.AAC.2